VDAGLDHGVDHRAVGGHQKNRQVATSDTRSDRSATDWLRAHVIRPDGFWLGVAESAPVCAYGSTMSGNVLVKRVTALIEVPQVANRLMLVTHLFLRPERGVTRP